MRRVLSAAVLRVCPPGLSSQAAGRMLEVHADKGVRRAGGEK